MKKLISALVCAALACNVANASFEEHYNSAQQYLSQFQYSSAIMEFKKALRINYLDNSARVGLINSYLARGTYLANKDRDWEHAANDYRAALFYLKYYPSSQDVQNSSSAIANAVQNLNVCLSELKFNTSPSSRYQKAKALRSDGSFAEAGYEFAQTLSDTSIKKNSLEQIGDIMKVLGNDPRAAEYYQKAVAVGANDADLRLKYARVLDKLGRSDEAVNEYNFALTRSGDNSEVLYSLEKIYRQKMELEPNNAEVLSNLGAIMQKQNKYDEAIKYYNQSTQIDPSSVNTRLNMGTLYQQKKDFESAIAAYDSILTLYPNNVMANLYRAQCYAAMGQNEKALNGFKTVLSYDPNNKEAKNLMLETIRTSMSPQEVLVYVEKNAANNTEAAKTLYDYALDLHKQEKYDDAVTYYKEVLRLGSENPEVSVNLAIVYKQKNDLAQAVKILQEAKQKYPENTQIADTLKTFLQEGSSQKLLEASKLYGSGDYQKALSIYQAILPQNYDTMVGAAACYKGLNQDDKALELYKKAFQNKSTDSDVAYYIGVLYSEKENWEDSKYYLKKALALNKNNAKAKDLYDTVLEQADIKLVDKAIDLYDKKDYTKSQKLLNEVIATNAKNAYAYYYRGLISDAQKRYQAALIDYKKAMQFSPDLTVINYLIALDYDALLQYKNALFYYKKFVTLTKEDNEYKNYAQSRIKALKKYE